MKKNFFGINDERKRIIVCIISILFSISIFVGISLTYGDGLSNIIHVIGILIIAMLFSPIFVLIFNKIFNFIEKNEKENIDIKIKYSDFFKVWAIIFLFWIPILLAFYPGIFDYDVNTQLNYVINDNYSTHHPLLHTLILGAFYNLGKVLNDYNLGILLYTIVQMLILSAVMSYAVMYIKKKGIKNKYIYISVIFYSIFPLCSILAISTTKDIYFSALILAFLICIMQIRDDKFKFSKKYIFLCIILTAMLLFRINAIYAVVIALAIILFLGVKQYKNLILTIIISILLSSSTQTCLVHILGASTNTEKDMLSIPLQQLARVGNVYKDRLTENEYHEITRYLNPVQYDEYLADNMKESANMNLIKKDYKNFIKTWAKYFSKFPLVYIEAFLYNTQGYWDIKDISHSKIYGIDLEKHRGYLHTGCKEEYGVQRITYCEPIKSFYEWLFVENNYQKFPIIRLLFSPALYIWIFTFHFIYSIYKKKKNSLIISAFFIGLFITLLAGPTCLARYVYPYVICLPVIICDLFIKEKI